MGLDSFKWILYGDDDTVFFIDGALKMLENLDHNMPYLLSDDVWFVEDDGKQLSQSCCYLQHILEGWLLGYVMLLVPPAAVYTRSSPVC